MLVFPLAAFAVGVTYNNAFLYLGFMLLLIVFPLLLTIAYFNILLLPNYCAGIKTRTVAFGESNMIIQFYRPDSDGEFVKDKIPVVIPYSSVSDFDFAKNHVIVRMNNKKLGIIAVPFDSFKNIEEMQTAIKHLNDNINKCE